MRFAHNKGLLGASPDDKKHLFMSMGNNKNNTNRIDKKKIPCKKFQRGECYRGEECWYNHGSTTADSKRPPSNPNHKTECFHCGKLGHKKQDCRKLKKEQEEANQAKANVAVEEEEEDENPFGFMMVEDTCDDGMSR